MDLVTKVMQLEKLVEILMTQQGPKTGNGYIYFGTGNDGAPSASNMTGAKIVFYNPGNYSKTAYDIGEESGYMWFNVPSGAGFKWYMDGVLKLAIPQGGLTDFANNAAAVTGGLTAGMLYTETGTNPKRVCVVY